MLVALSQIGEIDVEIAARCRQMVEVREGNQPCIATRSRSFPRGLYLRPLGRKEALILKYLISLFCKVLMGVVQNESTFDVQFVSNCDNRPSVDRLLHNPLPSNGRLWDLSSTLKG